MHDITTAILAHKWCAGIMGFHCFAGQQTTAACESFKNTTEGKLKSQPGRSHCARIDELVKRMMKDVLDDHMKFQTASEGVLRVCK